MRIERAERFPDDPNQSPMYHVFIGGRVTRVFFKRWALPYGFHRYGVRCFGAGPVGFMLFDAVAK